MTLLQEPGLHLLRAKIMNDYPELWAAIRTLHIYKGAKDICRHFGIPEPLPTDEINEASRRIYEAICSQEKST